MSRFKKLICIIAALLVLVPISFVGIAHLYDSLTPEAIQAWQEGRLSLGEIFDEKGNPFAHRFSDMKDIRGATYVFAPSDAEHRYDCDLRGNGTADETQIQALIDWCVDGGSVVILEGTASINANLLIIEPEYPDREGINLVGQGRGTILLATGAIGSVIQIGDATHQPNSVYIGHMQINGNSKACEVGILHYDGARNTFENLVVTQFKYFGIEAQYNHSLNINFCLIQGCGDGTEVPGTYPYVGGIKVGDGPGGRNLPFNSIYIYECLIEDCYDGIWFTQSTDSAVRDTTIEGNDRHGIVFDYEATGNTLPMSIVIDGCGFEANNQGTIANTADIYGNDVFYGIQIVNCYFHDSDVTWAIGLQGAGLRSNLHIENCWFEDGTSTNIYLSNCWGVVIDKNRFCTPLTLTNCRSVAPLNLGQFRFDFDDGLQSLEAGMSLYVPGMSGGNVYELSEKFTFPGNNITIFGDGAGSILKLADGVNDDVLYATGKSGLVIKDLALDGNRTNNAAAEPIELDACTDCKILNVDISEADDHGIYITGASSNLHIIACRIDGCDSYGIHLESSSITDSQILNNTILSCDRGIYALSCPRIRIRGNHIEGATTYGIKGSFLHSIISHNVFYNITGADHCGIFMAGGNNLISDNVFDTCQEGIILDDSDDNMMKNNLFRGCAFPIDILAVGSDRNMVMGNNWYGCTNDMTDNGNLTRITSNIDKLGAWLAGDNPG